MNQIDLLLRSFGDDTPAGDDAENEALRAARRVLHAAATAEQKSPRASSDGRLHLLAERSRRILRRARSRRVRVVVLFATLAIVGVAVPAFGVADGWFAGGGPTAGIRGSADPKLTGPPVVVATGGPGQPWTLVIARSNQNLCLSVDQGDEDFSTDMHRHGDCSYSDIRGELPPDVRGDPSAPCIGLDAIVPCGSLPRYWVQTGASGTYVPEIERFILADAAAADVASVELVLANGGTVQAEVVERPLGPDVPLNVYWAELGLEHGLTLTPWRNADGHRMWCDDQLVEMAVARDSQGRVLGRRVPPWNANPTGDPGGQRPPRTTEPCT